MKNDLIMYKTRMLSLITFLLKSSNLALSRHQDKAMKVKANILINKKPLYMQLDTT